MIQLLIIADDFTGALDAGVQLAVRGAKTAVITDAAADWSESARDLDVLVVDAETRHLPAAQAYEIVFRIVTLAARLQVPYIYKKTDSALRGNVGAELSAVLHARGETQLPFLPAFPQIGRCTVKGVHYIQGVPVDQSVFGKDPFEPVKQSRVDQLVASQTQDPVISLPALTAGAQTPEQKGILIFDAESEEDLFATGHALQKAGRLRIMAGCAGFAAMLPELLDSCRGERHFTMPRLHQRLLMLCGSVNPITLTQLERAEQAGFLRLRMRPDQKLEPEYWETPAGREQLECWIDQLEQGGHAVIDSNDPGGNEPTARYAQEQGLTLEEVRQRISGSLGQILKAVHDHGVEGTLLITGGDTLKQCMDRLEVYQIEPLCELEPGVVLSRFAYQDVTRYVISKSGGFGSENLLVNLVNRLSQPVCSQYER